MFVDDQVVVFNIALIIHRRIATLLYLVNKGSWQTYNQCGFVSAYQKLYAEEQQLSERLAMLKSQNQTSEETQAKLDKIMDMIEHEKFELETFDNVLIRKLIECVKVMSKTEILVIFKGGYEVKSEIEQ